MVSTVKQSFEDLIPGQGLLPSSDCRIVVVPLSGAAAQTAFNEEDARVTVDGPSSASSSDTVHVVQGLVFPCRKQLCSDTFLWFLA